METTTLSELLKNDYKEKPKENVKEFTLDNDLSGKRVKVYVDGQGKAVVSHRGTQGIQDIFTDMRLLLGDKSSERFKHAKRIQKKAEAKYGGDNVTTIGHSLGASIAENVGQNSNKVITYNKPVVPTDLFNRTSKKQTDIRTSLDPISILRPLQKGKKAKIIQSKTVNGLYEHSTKALKNAPINFF